MSATLSDRFLFGLPWLCAPPASFAANLRALSQSDGIAGAQIMHLARHDLNLDQLIALDKTLTKAAARIDWADLPTLRLAILARGSMNYTGPALRATALRHGLHLTSYIPDFGQATAEVMVPDSGLRRFAPDAALLAETAEGLGLAAPLIEPETAAAHVAAALGATRMQATRLREMGCGIILVQTLPAAPLAWAGHLDHSLPGSVQSQVAAYNTGLRHLAQDQALIVLDAGLLAAQLGGMVWFDDALWHRAKVPMALDVIPLYADHVLRLLRAAQGKSAKCLVLDLDNTCWGGVIGDDGLDGIRLGQGSAEGEAFLAIQRYALSLKARGIILAVCSKNDPANARLPFEQHPDMALRLDDIAVFVANWTDKATNILQIARTLNIGSDALVFLDDNPAERARVRQSCPEVMVPEVGDDPSLYPGLLSRAGYFETLALTTDDVKRADQYRANSQRLAQMEMVGDYDSYLASLDMTCEIRPFDATGRARIVQLINKSNQFNLTTRRYSEAEVAAIEADPACLALQVRLTDSFGDNGMISVVIFRKAGDNWHCDTWLMSCRVLKRRVEEAVLGIVAGLAHSQGARRLVGTYIPSSKNGIVADHFAGLGFAALEGGPEGQTRWTLDLAGYQRTDLPMQIVADTMAPAPKGP